MKQSPWSMAWGWGLVVLAACLAGCDGEASAPPAATGNAGAVQAPSAPTPVIATWQPVNKTAEFLGAWRNKGQKD